MNWRDDGGGGGCEWDTSPRVSPLPAIQRLATTSSDVHELDGGSLNEQTMTYQSVPTESCEDQATELLATPCRPLTSWDSLALQVTTKYPRYNVRTVVHKSEHPLWSPSLKTRLDYLVGDPLRKLIASYSAAGDVSAVGSGRASQLRAQDQLLPVIARESSSAHPFPRYQHGTQADETGVDAATIFSENSSWTPNATCLRRRRDDATGGCAQRTPAVGELRSQGSTGVMCDEHKSLGPRERATLRLLCERDEIVAREAIIEEARIGVTCLLSQCVHVASDVSCTEELCNIDDAVGEILRDTISEGCKEISIREQYNRSYILEEEGKAFEPIWDLFAYVHRGMLMGSAPLKNYLTRCVHLVRGRKERHRAKLQQLTEREASSRHEILEEHAAAQREVKCALVVAIEMMFRVELESFQLLTQFAQVHAWLLMRSQVEAYPKLYGVGMSRPLSCGRMKGTTLFRELYLRHLHDHNRICMWEEHSRTMIQRAMELDAVALFEEEEERRLVEVEEGRERIHRELLVLALLERSHAREIEIVEACERDVDLMRRFRAGCTAICEEQNARELEGLPTTTREGCS